MPCVALALWGSIEATCGEHLLVAQDARAFAKQVVCSLQDPALQSHLARNAQWLAEETGVRGR